MMGLASGLCCLHLPDPAATDTLGARLAGVLGGGDTVLLSGPLGAGKSALARAVIRALAGDPALEVPSPSYTLVNTYAVGGCEVWHIDLYRLGSGEDLTELGLEAGRRDDVLSLVEWPERLPERPARCLTISLRPEGDGRCADIRATGPGWAPVLTALGALS